MRVRKTQVVMFYVASSAGFLIETALLSIGLSVVGVAALTGLNPTAFASFINLLVDHFLAAPLLAKVEFVGGMAFALVVIFVCVGVVRAPAQFRRIRQDAEQRFVRVLHKPMPRPEPKGDAADE